MTNRFVSLIRTIGHDAKVTGKVTAKVGLRVVEIAAPLAGEVYTGGALADLLPHVIPALKISAHGFDQSSGGDEVNPLETMAISMLLGVLQTTLKNPAHREAVKQQLLGVADDIYMAYGVPPAHALQPTGGAAASL